MKHVVTFLSDFGLSDAYVAQVKARILSAAEDTLIVDITHEIPSYEIISGAWLLYTSYALFSKGAVHLAVVDPGVGTERGIIAVKKAGHLFIGPDNGIFSFLFPADEVIEVTWRPEGPVSTTFHGRDIFAPVVGKVLHDPSCSSLGTALKDPFMIDVKRPMVVHIDKFGNVVTNIECSHLKPRMVLRVEKMRIDRIAGTFADIPEGESALVCGSADTIEIAANRESAAQMIGAYVGMPVRVDYPDLTA